MISSDIGNSTSPSNQETEQYLFNSTEEFKNAFNQYCASNELDFRINSPEIQSLDEDTNFFRCILTDNLKLTGPIIKSTGGIKQINVNSTTDGNITTGNNIVLCMIAIIAIVDPTLPAESRGKILDKLKMFDKNKFRTTRQKIIMNEIKYEIDSNPGMLILFSASIDTDSN